MEAASSFKTMVSNFHITISDFPKTIILIFCQGPTYLTSLDLLLYSFKRFLITTNLPGHNIRIKHLTIHQLHRHQLPCDRTIEHYLCPLLSLQLQLGACPDRSARERTAGIRYKTLQASQQTQNQTKWTSLNPILPLQ
jgi:hypothetical protein